MVDYSRWKDIEVSDDEDDTHPNIDKSSLFRWRHEARVKRMQEMDDEKKEIQKAKEVLTEKKKELQKMRESGDAGLAVKEKQYHQEAQRLADHEAAFSKKEKLCPWNVDTIMKDSWSVTVMNAEPNRERKQELSEEEKGKRLTQFKKVNEEVLKKFGMLRKFEDSKRFLMDNPQLVCEDTAKYLVLWCIELAMENKFYLMDHVSHQCISMQFLLELAKQLDRDPRGCVSTFFTKLALAEQTEYKHAFDAELELFRQRIRHRAEEKVKELMKEAEEVEHGKQLGPGGLDPAEVFANLPEVLQNCFKTQNIPMLENAITEMPLEEANYHMKRCIDSGLWCPANHDVVDHVVKQSNHGDEAGHSEACGGSA